MSALHADGVSPDSREPCSVCHDQSESSPYSTSGSLWNRLVIVLLNRGCLLRKAGTNRRRRKEKHILDTRRCLAAIGLIASAAWPAKGHVRLEWHLFQGCSKGPRLSGDPRIHLIHDHDGREFIADGMVCASAQARAPGERDTGLFRAFFSSSSLHRYLNDRLHDGRAGSLEYRPLVYSAAGKQSKVAPGIALATVRA